MLIQNVEGDVKGFSMGGEVVYRPLAHSSKGSGVAAEGRNRVFLKTINGNITLRRR